MRTYEPFILPVGPLETMIERVPAGELTRRVPEWKRLREQGWVLTVLVAPDSRTVVALGCRGGAPVTVQFPREPEPYQAALLQALGARWEIDPDAPAVCPCGCAHRGNDYSIKLRGRA